MASVGIAQFRQRLRELRQSEVQEEILRVAARLFAERGYQEVTIGDIATSMGFSKSSIYYYFESKEDVLWGIFEAIHNLYFKEAQSADVEQPGPAEKLAQIIHSHVLTVLKNRDWTTIFFRDFRALSKKRQGVVDEHRRAYVTLIEEVYEAGRKRKTFKDIPASIAVNGILGMCNSVSSWFDDHGRVSAEQLANYFVDVLRDGYEDRKRGSRASGVSPVAEAAT